MTIASLFRVSALSMIALCGVVAFDQAAPGVFLSEAVAQDKPKKDTRETRRTPALRNKVYERLAEAQTLAEAKDYNGAAAILNDMISEDGKQALNSYELANVYNLHAFLSYANENYSQSLRYYEQYQQLLPQQQAAPYNQIWFRAVAPLPDAPWLHRCLLAYASDFNLIATALKPHGRSWYSPDMMVASLDHALWFHRDARIDDWLLYDMDSPSAQGARGMTRGLIYSRDGALVASVAQEGLMRHRPDATAVRA